MSTPDIAEGIFDITSPVVSSFPVLLEAKAFVKDGKPQGDPKFSLNLNFENESAELKAIKEKAAKIARAANPGVPFFLTTQEGVKLPQIILPWQSGDKLADVRKAKKGKDDGDFQRGKTVIVCRSKYQPRLAYIENGKIVELETVVAQQAHKSKFYHGVKVLAQINLVAYPAIGDRGLPGVSAYLNMVLSTNQGPKLLGGQSVSEAFKGYVGSISAENPMGPGADDDLSDLMSL